MKVSKLRIALLSACLWATASAGAYASDRLLFVCESYLDGEAMNKVLILEQLKSDVISGSDFMEQGEYGKTPWVEFSISIYDATLVGAAETDVIALGDRIRSEAQLIDGHDGQKYDYQGEARNWSGNVLFQYQGTIPIRFQVAEKIITESDLQYPEDPRFYPETYDCKGPAFRAD